MTEIVTIQKQFGTHLYNFIKSRVYSEDDANDIYQEVLLKLMSNSHFLNKPKSFKSWLFTIAKNQIIDYYRKKRPDSNIEVLVNTNEIQENKAYQELEGCLAGFVKALPEDYRQVIELSELEGKSQKEVAEILNINYVTLRSKVQRGREKIKIMIMESCAIQHDSTGGLADCSPKNSGCQSDSTCN